MDVNRELDPSDDPKTEDGVGAVLLSCLGCLVFAVVIPCAGILAYKLLLAFDHWIERVL